MEACESLKGYMELTEAVRRFHREEKSIDRAVVRAVDYCLEKGYLVEFLTKYRNEVIAMWIKEYTFEDYQEDMEEEKEELKKQLKKQNSEWEKRYGELKNENGELKKELEMLKKQLAVQGK